MRRCTLYILVCGFAACATPTLKDSPSSTASANGGSSASAAGGQTTAPADVGGIGGGAGSSVSGGSSSAGDAALGGSAGVAGSPDSSGGSTSGAAGESGASGAGGVDGTAGASAGSAGDGGSGVITEPNCADNPLTSKTAWRASASHSSRGNNTETDPLFNPPEHLIDNNLAERWSSGKAQAGDEWFEIDFGNAVTISQITLQVGGNTGDYPRSYQVRLSDTAGSTSAEVLASGNGTTGDTIISLQMRATGRYLRISQTATSTGSWWSIAEVQITCP